MDYIVLRDPPPNRRLRCEGDKERHLTEAAVMIAFGLYLLDEGATTVELHPDGEHAKRYDIRGCLEAHGFRLVSTAGTTGYGGTYQRGQLTVSVSSTPGLGDVLADLRQQHLVAECKGGITNTRHGGQVQKLRRGLCEAVGLLMARVRCGERQVAVVPATDVTRRLAHLMWPRASEAGIEIALVDEAGGVTFAASRRQRFPKVLGVIPARLESTRLPRKALRPICGQPMIVWVYKRARQARCFDGLLVATDAEEIASVCRQFLIPVMMTSAAHRTGTDRVCEVMTREPAEVYVNIQGDEPMITPQHVELLLRPFHDDPATQVSTLKVAMGLDAARSPHNVKVVTDGRGRAVYFSRALIPYNREGSGRVQYYKHLGFYAYARAGLEKFHNLPPSQLEQIEKLEQLRFLENGIPITVMETSQDTIGVDTEEDWERVEEYFRSKGSAL